MIQFTLPKKPGNNNEIFDYGAPLLHLATVTGNFTLVKALVQRHADVNGRSLEGASALAWGAAAGHSEICLYLLAQGADVNATDRFGITPLMQSARSGHLAVTTVLIEQQARLRDTDSDRFPWSALHYAQINGHDDIIHYLVSLSAAAKLEFENFWLKQPVFHHRQAHFDQFQKDYEAFRKNNGGPLKSLLQRLVTFFSLKGTRQTDAPGYRFTPHFFALLEAHGLEACQIVLTQSDDFDPLVFATIWDHLNKSGKSTLLSTLTASPSFTSMFGDISQETLITHLRTGHEYAAHVAKQAVVMFPDQLKQSDERTLATLLRFACDSETARHCASAYSKALSKSALVRMGFKLGTKPLSPEVFESLLNHRTKLVRQMALTTLLSSEHASIVAILSRLQDTLSGPMQQKVALRLQLIDETHAQQPDSLFQHPSLLNNTVMTPRVKQFLRSPTTASKDDCLFLQRLHSEVFLALSPVLMDVVEVNESHRTLIRDVLKNCATTDIQHWGWFADKRKVVRAVGLAILLAGDDVILMQEMVDASDFLAVEKKAIRSRIKALQPTR